MDPRGIGRIWDETALTAQGKQGADGRVGGGGGGWGQWCHESRWMGATRRRTRNGRLRAGFKRVRMESVRFERFLSGELGRACTDRWLLCMHIVEDYLVI